MGVDVSTIIGDLQENREGVGMMDIFYHHNPLKFARCEYEAALDAIEMGAIL